MNTTETSQSLIIVGAGGAGLEALMVARRIGKWNILGFADDDASLVGRSFEGAPTIGAVELVITQYGEQGHWFHCAIGRNITRKRLAEAFEARGFLPATLIDPTAVVAESAVIGEGAYIGPQAFVGPLARVGRHVLVNVGASVGHHVACGNFSQVCPGAQLSGHVELGDGSFVGSNAVAVPGIKVGEWATLAAASLATRDVPPRVTAMGVPAKMLAAPPPPV